MRVLCAYNVNLDAIHTVRGEELQGLLLSPLGKICAEMPESISRPEDFFSALLCYMKTGHGAELLIDNKDTANFLERAFSWKYRMGGNAGNMANTLALLGTQPVANVPSLTQRQASMFQPGVLVPGQGGDELVYPNEAVRGGEDLIHYVIQFIGGEKVMFQGETLITPRENRFIATFDRLNPGLYTNPSFNSYTSKHLDQVKGALISGFHLCPPDEFREVMDPAIERVNSWKEEKPDLYIHAEMGSFQGEDAARHMIGQIASDSIGMNEDELSLVQPFEPGWRGILDAILSLKREFGFPRICVHTKDFIMSLISGLLSPEEEIEALSYGARVAAALGLHRRGDEGA
jgi:ADP-dependent phosphofructokinase/glucokinase